MFVSENPLLALLVVRFILTLHTYMYNVKPYCPCGSILSKTKQLALNASAEDNPLTLGAFHHKCIFWTFWRFSV